MLKTAAELIKAAQAQVPHVLAQEAATEAASGAAVLLDVREAQEWQHGHIEGAIPAPRGLVEFFADPTSPRHKKDLDPTGRVIVVCASGARAALAAATLKDMGYENIAVLDGGLKAWMAAGLPHQRARIRRHLIPPPATINPSRAAAVTGHPETAAAESGAPFSDTARRARPVIQR